MQLLNVLRVEWHGEGIFSLFLERKDLQFTPGDCLALYAEDGETSRPYSIASGTKDEEVEFLIRRIPGGALSDWLSKCKVGDSIKVSPPFGWFQPSVVPHDVPFVYFATGTGIAPLLSHLRSGGKAPVQLFYGVRFAEDFVELPELPCLRTAVSREDGVPHHHGRLSDLFKEVSVDTKTHFFACGLDAMVEEVTSMLQQRGVPREQIHGECFFNAKSIDRLME